MKEIMTPAQLNRMWAKKTYSGTLAIFTVVSGWYQWYLPMFFDRVKNEYPGATPIVFVRGPIEIPEPWASMCHKSEILDKYPMTPFTTAALRYVYSDTNLETFDFVHITDADMLLQAEDPDMINQHMRHMNRHELICYDNYVSTWVGGRPKCPGVHFVTQKWWGKTALARENNSRLLMDKGSPSWEHDEIMLGSIIQQSGLPLCTEPVLWAHHGIHLGDWRRRLQMKHSYAPPDASQQTYIRHLLADAEFMRIVALCIPHVNKLKETFEVFKTL